MQNCFMYCKSKKMIPFYRSQSLTLNFKLTIYEHFEVYIDAFSVDTV